MGQWTNSHLSYFSGVDVCTTYLGTCAAGCNNNQYTLSSTSTRKIDFIHFVKQSSTIILGAIHSRRCPPSISLASWATRFPGDPFAESRKFLLLGESSVSSAAFLQKSQYFTSLSCCSIERISPVTYGERKGSIKELVRIHSKKSPSTAEVQFTKITPASKCDAVTPVTHVLPHCNVTRCMPSKVTAMSPQLCLPQKGIKDTKKCPCHAPTPQCRISPSVLHWQVLISPRTAWCKLSTKLDAKRPWHGGSHPHKNVFMLRIQKLKKTSFPSWFYIVNMSQNVLS